MQVITETHHMVIKIYKLLNELQGRCREHVTPGIDSMSNDNTNPLWYINTFKMSNVLRLTPQKVTDEGQNEM